MGICVLKKAAGNRRGTKKAHSPFSGWNVPDPDLQFFLFSHPYPCR
ncbi:hypothetical protein HMPREF9441_01076 [Paraprevotella clara YIT 11840]|uniref:Uncharacterized protein n=1 Tax=Paraprevotella clara YIT 11840 TaxID=762968 RepID=G5SP81_9BACT|nr:hypothetical protein HMPREF9441_01076 [Paraprevotella clara YIT 11840]